MDADIGRYNCWFAVKGGYKSLSEVDIKRAAKIIVADIGREEKYVIKPHLKMREGHCERSEHGPTGFRDGPQCSRQRVVPRGPYFQCFLHIFMAFPDHFLQILAIFGIFMAF